VNPDLGRAFEGQPGAADRHARCSGRCSRSSRWRPSTTNPVEMVRAHQREIVEAVAEQIHPRRRFRRWRAAPRRSGLIVAAALRRKRKRTMTTRTTVSINENCTVPHGSPDGRGAIGQDAHPSPTAARPWRAAARSRLMRSTTPMMFGTRLPLDVHDHGGDVAYPGPCFTFSASSLTSATSERRTAAPFRYAITRRR